MHTLAPNPLRLSFTRTYVHVYTRILQQCATDWCPTESCWFVSLWKSVQVARPPTRARSFPSETRVSFLGRFTASYETVFRMIKGGLSFSFPSIPETPAFASLLCIRITDRLDIFFVQNGWLNIAKIILQKVENDRPIGSTTIVRLNDSIFRVYSFLIYSLYVKETRDTKVHEKCYRYTRNNEILGYDGNFWQVDGVFDKTFSVA